MWLSLVRYGLVLLLRLGVFKGHECLRYERSDPSRPDQIRVLSTSIAVMSPVNAFKLFSIALPLLQGVQAGFDLNSANNVAVYWGVCVIPGMKARRSNLLQARTPSGSRRVIMCNSVYPITVKVSYVPIPGQTIVTNIAMQTVTSMYVPGSSVRSTPKLTG